MFSKKYIDIPYKIEEILKKLEASGARKLTNSDIKDLELGYQFEALSQDGIDPVYYKSGNLIYVTVFNKAIKKFEAYLINKRLSESYLYYKSYYKLSILIEMSHEHLDPLKYTMHWKSLEAD